VFTAENNLSGSRDNQFHFYERRRRRRNKKKKKKWRGF